MTYRLLLIAVACGVLCEAASAQGVVIARDGKPQAAIVIRKDASPSEKRGAQEFMTHIKQMSGATLDVIADDQPLPQRAILVGYSRHLATLKVEPPVKELGEEGFLLQTHGEHVIIAGSHVRGAMYGCSALLETLGVRWFTAKITQIPQSATLTVPPLDRMEIPAFEYREPFFTEAFERDWAARLRVNGHSARLDEATGGKIRYRPFAHSFEEMIPPALFKDHPEYFPLIKGKRTGGYVQRCLSNPEVLKVSIATVRQWIAKDPGARLYSVTQNDCHNTCECDKCNEIAKKYGGQSGLYLWFVNQIAEDIEKDHPEKLIDTFAYQFTEAPPTGIVPRANVRIRLCPIACCQAHPFEQCASKPSVEFMKNLNGWAKLTRTLYIWDYNINFHGYLLPFPDFKEFPAAARLYQRLGVKGVFFQGGYAAGGGSSDAEMRSWVMARLLWNPQLDADALVTEWMKGVYGPAAPPMRKWFDLLHQNAARPDKHMFIFDRSPVHYLDAETLATGDKLFDEAEKLADSQLAKEQLFKARLWLRYAKLANRPTGGAELDSFEADVKRLGIGQLREGVPAQKWFEEYRKRLPK